MSGDIVMNQVKYITFKLVGLFPLFPIFEFFRRIIYVGRDF